MQNEKQFANLRFVIHFPKVIPGPYFFVKGNVVSVPKKNQRNTDAYMEPLVAVYAQFLESFATQRFSPYLTQK